MKEHKLGVGMIGLGPLTYAHQQGIADSADIAVPVAFCDLDEQLAAERARPFGAKVYTDYRELLKDQDVDVVFILLPHHLHYPVAKDALEHGKYVLIEKPLTIVASEGLELIELAQNKHLQFIVAENTRFITAYIEAEKYLREDTLGDVYLVRTFIAGNEIYRMADPNNWKGRKTGSGGGAIIDSMPHTFYLLRWLFGGVRDVQAFAEKLTEDSEVEDNSVIVGHLMGGGIYTAQVSFVVQAPWTERLEIYGSKGSLIIDQLCNPPALYYSGENDFNPTPLENVPFDDLLWKYTSIVAECTSFLRSVSRGDDPVINPMDAYYAILAIEKSYESMALGRPVPVPEIHN
ncbi:MAG: Gfo/Idh/MocA family oxidoreductase [Deltaproteobacteria bacterium]|nr:Gfo/Idh/MocA family oxidoreductase [Deltaproteobacteria bacterium]